MEKQNGNSGAHEQESSNERAARQNEPANESKVDLQGGHPTDTPGEKTGEGDRTDTPEMEELNDE
jgi:hypothetical protein